MLKLGFLRSGRFSEAIPEALKKEYPEKLHPLTYVIDLMTQG